MCVGRVLLALLDVLPRPLGRDDPLEGRLEVARDSGIGVLVHRHAGRRVGHVHEHGGGAVGIADAPPRRAA